MLGFPTWVILAVECFFHRRRNQKAKQGELNYTISSCQRRSCNLSFFRLIAFCREKSSHVTVVSTNSFMCFVHIVGNRAAFFTVPYHQVQRHSWSQAFPLLEAQDPLRARGPTESHILLLLVKKTTAPPIDPQSGFLPWCWYDPTLPKRSWPGIFQGDVSCGHKSNFCLFLGIRIELLN